MTRKKVKAYAKWNPITSTCVDDYYKELRAYLDDFQKVGTGVSFAEEDKVARIIISNDKVLLFVAGDFAKYQENNDVIIFIADLHDVIASLYLLCFSKASASL